MARRAWKRFESAAWPAIAVAALILAGQGGCSSVRPALTLVFENVPAAGEEQPPRPVVRNPRRPTYKPPESLVQVIVIPDLPPAIDWNARYRALPRNDAGEVAWVRALNEKVITPKPGLAPDAKDDEPTDMDIELIPKDQPDFKVVFPHRQHTQWLGCANCHTDIFEMEKGKARMTMADLGDGKYCGVCHGKVALPDLAGCAACHTAMGK